MFAAYIRVSTTGQNEAGQRAEIENWLAGHGITKVRWYIDKKSGDNLKRPEFERLQNDIFRGEVRTVVVWKIDRLSRKMSDGINTLTDWLNRDVRFISVTQNFDFEGAIGKIIAALLFGIAEMEQETRRERQAVGIAAAKKRGVYKGRKTGSTKAEPSRAKELLERGLTKTEIAQAMGVNRMTVYRYLETALSGA